MTRCSVYSGFDKLNHHTFFLFFDTNDFWIFSGEYRFRKKFGMTECFRRFISYNSYFVVYASSGGFDTALPTQPPRVAIMVVSSLHRFVASYFMPHTSCLILRSFIFRGFILHSTTVIMSAPWSPEVLERKRKNAREQRAEGWNLFVMNSLQEKLI